MAMCMTGALDLYCVLVENVFGTVLLSILAMSIVIIIILAMCRSSMTFIIGWMLLYIVVMLSMYVGALGLVLFTLFGIGYFSYALIRMLINRE